MSKWSFFIEKIRKFMESHLIDDFVRCVSLLQAVIWTFGIIKKIVKAALFKFERVWNIIKKRWSKKLADEELAKRQRQEEKRRIELARGCLTEIGNYHIFRKVIEEAKKKGTLEAYWELQDKLSRELANHLIIYKGHDEACAFSWRLANILNGIDIG